MKKILGLAMVLMAAAAPAMRAVGRGQRNVAILIFPGVQIIDYTGPYEVLGHASVNGQRAFQIDTVSENTEPITTAMGMTVVPAFAFDRAPGPTSSSSRVEASTRTWKTRRTSGGFARAPGTPRSSCRSATAPSFWRRRGCSTGSKRRPSPG